LIHIKVLPAGLPKLVDSQIMSGDHMQPFQKDPTRLEYFKRQLVNGSWIAACNIPYLQAAFLHPFTISRSVATTFLKISKKQRNTQLTVANKEKNQQHEQNEPKEVMS
jgi:hypothetical protein